MISIFNGKEIDKTKIDILKNIAYGRYASSIYENYFADINSIDDLAYSHSTNVEDENLVLGTDWFMCYSVTDYDITILEWVALNTEHKMQQVVEMMNFLKHIFLQNKDKWVRADMRHDTSFLMYNKMQQKGYFKELSHTCMIDCSAPPEVSNLKYKLMTSFNSIEEFLSSDVSSNYSEYLKYILHHIDFKITDNFIKRYNNTSADGQVLGLKRK